MQLHSCQTMRAPIELQVWQLQPRSSLSTGSRFVLITYSLDSLQIEGDVVESNDRPMTHAHHEGEYVGSVDFSYIRTPRLEGVNFAWRPSFRSCVLFQPGLASELLKSMSASTQHMFKQIPRLACERSSK